MQLAAWVLLCTAVAVATRRRPLPALCAVAVAWFALPAVASRLVTGQSGGPLSFHAATWLILLAATVRLLGNPRSVAAVLARRPLVFLSLGLVVSAAVASTLAGTGAFVLLVDQILAPVLFFLLLLVAAREDPGVLPTFRNLLVALGAAVAALAVAQSLAGRALVYEAAFATQYWFGREEGRWMGSLDQPLALAFALTVTAPLIAGLRRLSLQLPLLVLFALGVLVSRSRVGLVVIVLVAVFVVARSRAHPAARIGVLGVLAAVGLVLAATPFVDGVASRFLDDTGSSQARADALGFFLRHGGQYLLAGEGMTGSYALADLGGLDSSLESSILMYSVDIGIVFALLYFGTMAVLVAGNFPQRVCPGLSVAALLAIVIPQTYSALATRSVAGLLVWTVLGLVVLAGDATTRGATQPGPAPGGRLPAVGGPARGIGRT